MTGGCHSRELYSYSGKEGAHGQEIGDCVDKPILKVLAFQIRSAHAIRLFHFKPIQQNARLVGLTRVDRVIYGSCQPSRQDLAFPISYLSATIADYRFL